MSDPILDAVDRLAPTLAASGLDTLEVESDGLRIRLARPQPLAALAPAATAAPTSAVPAVPATRGPTADTPWGAPAAGRRFVAAPLTGIWYTAPSPGARPYVVEGSEVAAGAVIGLIEAMKLFNEIKTDVAGTVTRVLVESGMLVKRQQPLLEIDPS